MPSIGIYLALAAGIESIYLKHQRGFILTVCGIIGLFTILVWFRNYEWKDAFTLYKSAVKNNPLSAVAHNNLGIAYLDINLLDAAEREFKKTLSLSNSVDAQINSLINLANIYSRQNKFEEAKQKLDEALKIKPNFAAIYQTYGFIYKQQGEIERAEKIWKEGLSFNTKTTGILDNLGLLYLEENKIAEAKICFQKAIQVNPDSYLAYFGLGQILEQESNIDQAISHYKKSVELNPSDSILHYAIGRLYARQSNPKALYYLKESLKLNPAIAEGHNDLAVLYASNGAAEIRPGQGTRPKGAFLRISGRKRVLETYRDRRGGKRGKKLVVRILLAPLFGEHTLIKALLGKVLELSGNLKDLGGIQELIVFVGNHPDMHPQ